MAALNRHGAPKNAILFLLLISLPIPFLGRSAIGWIVDVNTIGVTIAYAYTSAAAFKSAREQKRVGLQITGLLGLGISAFFLLYFLVPNLSSVASLTSESYLMLMSWLALGFIVFLLLFRRDRERRLGKSTAVWIILLLMIFSVAMIWITGTTRETTETTVDNLDASYSAELLKHGATPSEEELVRVSAQVEQHLNRMNSVILRNMVILFLIVLMSILIIFHIYNTVQRQRQTAVEDKQAAEQSNEAKSTFLSNMSHDIRTPMNAIVGYVTLAKREKDVSPRTMDYLDKIESSSGHLLALINDILEMSRIESGKMELAPVPTDVRKMMDEVRGLFSTQMEKKGLTYTVTCEEIRDEKVLCDQNRLNRVLLNLISNAFKFTPEGGSVTVTLRQTGREGDRASYDLSVKDTGIGMSPEFAAMVFEAYEREKNTTVENIQGTGLGTAITKSIVELMGGTIEVFSEQGKGSEFVVHVAFAVDPAAKTEWKRTAGVNAGHGFAGMHLLLVEDNEDNREMEKTLLEDAGFSVDVAVNGEDAVEIVAGSAPGTYAVVLMDIEMPEKNGYDATKLIRTLRNSDLASIPIVALTAKAFSEDIAACREAGMDAHIAKPLNMETAMKTLSDVLSRKA
ncbi:MAG: ATP-binding protein [Oscillospiraceae bacterium]|nr:ATP-binding protein [Oscillospiraceae bacterium]